jgi:hypothetical protein
MGACINGTTTFPTPSTTTVKTYSNSGSFISETGSTAFGYDNILSPTQAILRILGPLYQIPQSDVSIK